MSYLLLDRFQSLFTEGPYLHRVSNHGDSVALRLYEDLFAISRSKAFVADVNSALCVVNTQNKRQGIKARRGDGTLGEIVPNVLPVVEPGFAVKRGPTATIEIAIEVKILAKAMIKQVDRVISDLTGQAGHFRSHGGNAITIGVVGINFAPEYLSFEGERFFPTDGGKYKHPIQEAAEAERRLVQLAGPAFDQFLILRFAATNMGPPFGFHWLDPSTTAKDYGATLVRVSKVYEARRR